MIRASSEVQLGNAAPAVHIPFGDGTCIGEQVAGPGFRRYRLLVAYDPIGDYALVGDCHGSALVSRSGSVDWACLDRFDAGSVFCRLLDDRKGGAFALSPGKATATERRYLPDTNVLETTFTSGKGVARVLDCFAMRSGGRTHPLRQLLRVVEGVEGEVAFDGWIQPRFDYGSISPWLRHHAEQGVHSAIGGDAAFVLQADVPLEISDDASFRGAFTVRPGQRRRFSIVSCPPHDLRLEHLSAEELDRRLEATIGWWRRWVAAGTYDETYRDPVVRSALVLKALTCAPTGAIVAAPTTSLPEEPGGARNWDYRYSWVRDSAHTLEALLEVGHPEVATGFKLFMERATAGHVDDLQVMYGCYGERRLTEVELPHLDGYGGARPVRIGNGAAGQKQLDVYGELLDAAHSWRRAGSEVTAEGWAFLRGLVEAACARWREPDRGLWEMRGPPRHFVESKVMCWLALERGIRTAEELEMPCDLSRWREVRAEIRSAVEQEGVDGSRGCFVQSFGSGEVDASLLLLPLVGFVDANDPRMVATLEAIERDLSDGLLVRRYRTDGKGDGLVSGEAPFLLASFWRVDVLAMQGQVERAEAIFRDLLGLANDVGLLSEEYDPDRRELLGNFPQAYTHMAVINTAGNLRRARSSGGSPAGAVGREERAGGQEAGSTLQHAARGSHRDPT